MNRSIIVTDAAGEKHRLVVRALRCHEFPRFCSSIRGGEETIAAMVTDSVPEFIATLSTADVVRIAQIAHELNSDVASKWCDVVLKELDVMSPAIDRLQKALPVIEKAGSLIVSLGLSAAQQSPKEPQ